MSTHHHWFRSGNHTLLAHIDLPAAQTHRAVVIVPPFGWEDICSYRPLRALARSLARKGFATLRFDLPGTGDSSGSATDPGLFSAWIASIPDAIAELKAFSGVQAVSVLGVRLGAMLAIAAASTGANISSLVLWGASAKGRTLLRELRAFRNMEVSEFAEGETPPPPPIDGLEVAGFLISRETEAALEAMDVGNFHLSPNQRVLLLSRDSFPHDTKLTEILESAGCTVTLKSGFGYEKMMAAPHEPSAFPTELEDTLAPFLLNSTGPLAGEPRTSRGLPLPSAGVACLDNNVLETVLPQPYQGSSLFSILSQPEGATKSDWGLLLMNAGGVRHIGPNRMWVEAARRWAARGLPSLRLDSLRVGESDGDEHASIASLHGADLVDYLASMMKTMNARLGCKRFIAVGLCSGAFASFQSLIKNPAVRSALLLNPRLFFWDPAVEPRRLAKRVGTGLGDISDWRRLARGEIQPARVKHAARTAITRFLKSGPTLGRQRQIPAREMSEAWKQVSRFGTRVTLVFADGEPLFQEMVEEHQMRLLEGNPQVRCIQAGKVGHTFRALFAQRMVQDLIDSEINLLLSDSSSSSNAVLSENPPSEPSRRFERSEEKSDLIVGR